MNIAFKQVDVFTSTPYFGNPVAVVLDGRGLDDSAMQRIAAWTNLSETAFVLPPTSTAADYRLRIFTPRQELPFAGHPSVGTAHAVLEAGLIDAGKAQWTQECAAGLQPLRIEGSGPERRIFVRAPTAEIEESDMMLTHALARALGVAFRSEPAPRIVKVGPSWMVVDLERAAIVRGLTPNASALHAICRDFGAIGVNVFARETASSHQLVVRSFAPGDGIVEDPVCGSGNAAVAAYLHFTEQLETLGHTYVASQGREVGRDGRVHIAISPDGRAIEIGGAAVTCIDGNVRLG